MREIINTDNMKWNDINVTHTFTSNTTLNKEQRTKKTPSIIWAAIQLTERVYYLDFGKTYKGELSYFHYGLCVGKKEGKLLVIPITSADNYRDKCFHPVRNPKASKKMRQALKDEGFSKDCVLIMNDAKFVSAGRIEAIDNKINEAALLDIQSVLFAIMFPDINREHCKLISQSKAKDKKIVNQKEFIEKIKKENAELRCQINCFQKETINLA